MPTKNDPVKYNDQMRRLTPRQKDCLRLVARGYQSKPIARELGISHLRVDKHIAEARRILGTASRNEAAKLLHAWELQQDASARNNPWGAPPTALPQLLDRQSKEDTSSEGKLPAQKLEAESYTDMRPTLRSLGLERNVARESGKPSSLALFIAIAAVLAAIGAVATLLFALNWIGRG